jgi:hypothetical protein
MHIRHSYIPWFRVPTSIMISEFALPQCSTNTFTILRHRISYNSQLLTQIQLCISLTRHNSGYGSKAQTLFTEIYRCISFCLECVCNDIVQFPQHSDITGSQLQQLNRSTAPRPSDLWYYPLKLTQQPNFCF